jgi:hypothetical protein
MNSQQFAPNTQSLSFLQEYGFSKPVLYFSQMQRQKTRMNISPRKQRQHYFMASRNTEINKMHVLKTCLHTQDDIRIDLAFHELSENRTVLLIFKTFV